MGTGRGCDGDMSLPPSSVHCCFTQRFNFDTGQASPDSRP